MAPAKTSRRKKAGSASRSAKRQPKNKSRKGEPARVHSIDAVLGADAVSQPLTLAAPSSIAAAVVEDIAELSNHPAAQLSGAYSLTGPPLLFSDYGLTALAQRLWQLIRSQNPQGSISIAEVRQPGLTVAALVKLVLDRCRPS